MTMTNPTNPPLQTPPPSPDPSPAGARPITAIARTRIKNKTSLYAHGEPMVWFTGGALVLAVSMIVTLILWIIYQGSMTFWPLPVVQIDTLDGKTRMGEITRYESFRPAPDYLSNLKTSEPEAFTRIQAEMDQNKGYAARRLLRVGNFDVTGGRFDWVVNAEIKPNTETLPPWALVFERQSWGRFYGTPVSITIDGKTTPVTDNPAQLMALYKEFHPQTRARFEERRNLEIHEIGHVTRLQEDSRLALRKAEMDFGKHSPQYTHQEEISKSAQEIHKKEFDRIKGEISKINKVNENYAITVKTAQGVEKKIPLDEIVLMYAPNQLTFAGKLGVYAERWWELVSADPREANSEGGVLPAIFGTVVMTLVMSMLVVPFGVLAALYLREYAKAGPVVTVVRIAINNLAGVPSIVFGVFGLGFFCYKVGASIDQLFYSEKLPSPTYGTGGILWAAFTLALLTLPVVIVATEEALSAVPGSMREGSYACGASKWQTIRRIVLPRAMPGIMTGMILAMARGAGEVAPLMLVGAVKLAPELAVDTVAPFIHPERSFMHLGFHIYDLGFQSPDSEAARPMVYTTTLLLITIIALLNITAVIVRTQLRKKFVAQKF
jgi:phosphate transport system permease protein